MSQDSVEDHLLPEKDINNLREHLKKEGEIRDHGRKENLLNNANTGIKVLFWLGILSIVALVIGYLIGVFSDIKWLTEKIEFIYSKTMVPVSTFIVGILSRYGIASKSS